MSDLYSYMNIVEAERHNLEDVKEIEKCIKEWNDNCTLPNLTSFGRLIKDDHIKFKSTEDKTFQNRYIFIFDICVLVCERSQKTQVPLLKNCFVSDMAKQRSQFTYCISLHLRDYYAIDANEQCIYLAKKNHEKWYLLSARSEQDKKQIMKALCNARAYIHPGVLKKLSHRFTLKTFESPVRCNFCSKYLTGLIYQGYICEVCEVVIHKSCIEHTTNCWEPKNLKEKQWYIGRIGREANEKLKYRADGTFFVRYRESNGGINLYCLTVKYNGVLYNFKVYSSEDLPRRYYLHKNMKFTTLEELVSYYENHTIGEYFNNIPSGVILVRPYGLPDNEPLWAVVEKNYAYPHQPSMRKGTFVEILRQDPYNRNFWHGKCGDTFTTFPMNSVTRVESRDLIYFTDIDEN